MKFYDIVEQVILLLQREGRVSYRALKREFDLDEEYLEDLKEELITAKRLAREEDGRVLVWTREKQEAKSKEQEAKNAKEERSEAQRLPTAPSSALPALRAEGERRQLTVLFCDLVGSTALAVHLDPEEFREVVRAYQATCAAVIARFDGYIAQYLGDGLLVYFGYPVAHEDDAQRATRTGLGMVEAMRTSSSLSTLLQRPLQVRIGIHTGLVVVGEIGSGERREQLALGDTPNVAARLQALAEPNTVVISAATYRLVQGYLTCQDLGPHTLKGISAPVSVYSVVEERSIQSRFEVAVSAGLTPLVGRAEEMAVLRNRWERVKAGEGQVVLLGGEAGIGKSRLVQELKEQVTREGYTRIEFRCSPYHQRTAFSPVIEHLQRLLQVRHEESPQEKLAKLEQLLQGYRLPASDVVPLFAALLSLPHPDGYPPLTLTPQRQRQKLQEALWAWLLEEAERKPLLAAWEDLHWADPSTLELLTLFLSQAPMARTLTVLTFRPEFQPPWGNRSHLTSLMLSRLDRPQSEAMVAQLTERKALPTEVSEQIVSKTDGVPLFVEELTKMVLESGLLQEEDGRYALRGALPPLAIPPTLQDSLMARLDRLATVREVVQLGATLGREFSYELLRAVAPWEETILRDGLTQLVDAEMLYPRGLPPQARYVFKHALIQETAYQSMLKSKRQQYHHQIAQVLEGRFADVVESQPELLAHHYTEAGLIAEAIAYWQQAGQRAVPRSANVEAISHLSKGLELLKTLPGTPERVQQELALQIALGMPLVLTKGHAAPAVEATYSRARELCQQVGETPDLFSVLLGLRRFYYMRGELQTAHALGKQLLTLAQNLQDSGLLARAHLMQGEALYYLGDVARCREHLEQGIALYDSQQHRSHAFLYGNDTGVACLSYAAFALWVLGYPDQALQRSTGALSLAQELSHPPSLALALSLAATVHGFRREGQAAQKRAEALIALCTEHEFALFLVAGTFWRGTALAGQGQEEEGITQMRQGLAAYQATGSEVFRPYYLALLAEAYSKVGRTEEGLSLLAEALGLVDKTGARISEAELYRLCGELTLRQERQKAKIQPSPQPLIPSTQAEVEQKAGACFLKAIEIARKQQAKSLELRAVMSLVRLRHQQTAQDASRDTYHATRERLDDAHSMLSEIYYWFTEGFATTDLKEAKALLEELTIC